jgi:pyruvate kinase
VQKEITHRANQRAKPVIVATQMLESMSTYRLPTRAEATDVSNAILDGTDCVMLSGESATGAFPVEAVAMLGKIAATVEPARRRTTVEQMYSDVDLTGKIRPMDLVMVGIEATLGYLKPAAVFTHTEGGSSARRLASFHLPVWTVAITSNAKTARDLLLSSGVIPVLEANTPASWNAFVKDWVRRHQLDGEFAILTERPSVAEPGGNHRMEIVNL